MNNKMAETTTEGSRKENSKQIVIFGEHKIGTYIKEGLNSLKNVKEYARAITTTDTFHIPFAEESLGEFNIIADVEYLDADNVNLTNFTPIKESKYWTKTKANFIVGSWPPNIRGIPEKFITPEMCKFILTRKYLLYPPGYDAIPALFIDAIPETCLTEELCIFALKRGAYLSFIPPLFRTENVYLTALKYGESINNVPNEFRTPTIMAEWSNRKSKESGCIVS